MFGFCGIFSCSWGIENFLSAESGAIYRLTPGQFIGRVRGNLLVESGAIYRPSPGIDVLEQ